jgi:hypothetical protein
VATETARSTGSWTAYEFQDALSYLQRPEAPIRTIPRQQPERHKSRIVQARGFQTVHTLEETVAEFSYQPAAGKRAYRIIVPRKRLATDQGKSRLFEEYRYFFFISNDRTSTAGEVVLAANGRCNPENLVSQLKTGVHALTTPVDDLISNWAYMVASLAWSLKAWTALWIPEAPRHAAEHRAQKQMLLRMEFPTSRAAIIEMPRQIVRGSRWLVYRLLSLKP